MQHGQHGRKILLKEIMWKSESLVLPGVITDDPKTISQIEVFNQGSQGNDSGRIGRIKSPWQVFGGHQFEHLYGAGHFTDGDIEEEFQVGAHAFELVGLVLRWEDEFIAKFFVQGILGQGIELEPMVRQVFELKSGFIEGKQGVVEHTEAEAAVLEVIGEDPVPKTFNIGGNGGLEDQFIIGDFSWLCEDGQVVVKVEIIGFVQEVGQFVIEGIADIFCGQFLAGGGAEVDTGGADPDAMRQELVGEELEKLLLLEAIGQLHREAGAKLAVGKNGMNAWEGIGWVGINQE